MEKLTYLILWFFFYSFVGWVYESLLCSAMEKRLINRGFLNGPCCPIYGAGAVLILILFGDTTDPVALFLSSAVVTCTLEYVTSYVMEKLFHARWWDYSNMAFNLNGRVCLIGAVAFGTFSVLLIFVIHPAVAYQTSRIPGLIRNILVIFLSAVFITDLIFTLNALTSFRKKIEKAAAHLSEMRKLAGEKLHFPTHQLGLQQKRFIMAFPNLRLNKHNELLKDIRENLKSHRKSRKS